ncbi:MAG: DUF5661 family protein [bacterium]
MARKRFSNADVKHIASRLGVALNDDQVEQMVVGMWVEQEHADIARGDPFVYFAIAMAHIRENEHYYTYLVEMETHADGGQCVCRIKNGVFAFPPDHKWGSRVPSGGAMCANCGWLNRQAQCANVGYQNWRLSTGIKPKDASKLPYSPQMFCCDLWQSER